MKVDDGKDRFVSLPTMTVSSPTHSVSIPIIVVCLSKYHKTSSCTILQATLQLSNEITLGIYSFFSFNGSRSKRNRKQKKTPKENWFERLKVDELKGICVAAKLPGKGTKKVINERLMGCDRTCNYGLEGYLGTNLTSLKAECKHRNLVQSGTKLTLVKRLLEKDHGTNPEATVAATKRPKETDQDGLPKKKRKPTKPKSRETSRTSSEED